jgi:hypothetical protein
VPSIPMSTSKVWIPFSRVSAFPIGMSESYVRQAMPVLEHNLNAYLENDYGRMLNKVPG